MPSTSGRVKALFEAAIEQPPHARLDFVRQACDGDEVLFQDVAGLLEYHEDTEPPDAAARADPAGRATLEADLVGTIVGAYRVTRLLGKGAMGEVYLASRADGAFHRDVALKVVRGRTASKDLERRFEDECRILASLRHRFVAQLYDAGRTEDGRLYFVMEYVDGLRLTAYCEQHALPAPQRILLFQQVCEAVSFAHRNLIVHRDLKPGNVLVDADGHPRLLDFGIAKALTRAGLEASDPTAPHHQRMTPPYASPEQVRGEAAHTGMDVFALGVILHELITQVRPQPIAPDATTDEEGAHYRKPSAILVEGGARQARDLSRSLAADVDAILLRALSGDRQARYQSVDDMSRDLQAALEHRPVSARRPTRSYRGRKFVRRHRTPLVLAAVAIVAVMVAVASLVQQWVAAQRERATAVERFEQSRQLASSLFGLDASLAALPGATAAREALTQSLSRYLAGVRGTVTEDAGLLLDVAESYRRVGDVQGNPNGPNLGDRRGALASYAAAREILRGFDEAQRTSAVRAALAETLCSEADVFVVLARREDAARGYDEAYELTTPLASAQPGEPQHVALMARLHRATGDLALTENELEKASTRYQEALVTESGLARRFGNTPERQRLVALTRLRIASVHERRGQWREARDEYEEALSMLRAVRDGGLDSPGLLRDTAVGLTRLAQVTLAEDERSSREQIELAIGIFRQLSATDPADTRVRIDLYRALRQQGDLLRFSDLDAAVRHYREARTIAAALRTNGATVLEIERDLQELAARLTSGRAVSAPDLRLFALDRGQRIPIRPSQTVPPTATQIAAVVRLPPDVVGYVLMFGAEGEATLFDQAELERVGWTLPLSGPPPAQTVLLLTVPRALAGTERVTLVRQLSAIPGPRAVDYDSQVVWSSGEDVAIVSTASSRGTAGTDWIGAVRVQLTRLDGARFAGRTFPIAPQTQR